MKWKEIFYKCVWLLVVIYFYEVKNIYIFVEMDVLLKGKIVKINNKK